MSKVIVLTLTDEDFEDIWKMVNQTVELSEEKAMPLIQVMNPDVCRNPVIAYKGLFDVPEGYLKQVGQIAKSLNQSDIEVGCSVLLWRLIQGVLKNR